MAPAGEPVKAFLQRDDMLGNVDMPELCAGCTVVLRANVDGGMLSLGDAHLAQGDAEIHRSAIETQADVTLRITNLGADAVAYPGLPQINSAERLGSVAPGPGHLEDLVRAAYDDLAATYAMTTGSRSPRRIGCSVPSGPCGSARSCLRSSRPWP